KNYSKSYLSHLIMTGEMLGSRLNTIHNLNYYFKLMRQAREANVEKRWPEFRDKIIRCYA
ncbi:MAG: tRNA-guanine transglycosylase, partial [Bdellovibrionales bacterium]|nr:tRNA-guanine transglycosylase [Bdellovibrionales bacterium]